MGEDQAEEGGDDGVLFVGGGKAKGVEKEGWPERQTSA